MDASEFCGTPFWNSTESWDAQQPYISQCFQNLILVLGSCGVLWIVAPFEFYKVYKARGSPTPWTKLSITKMAFKGILLVICTLDVIKAVYSYLNFQRYGLDGLIAASAYFLTIALTVILTLMCKSKGLRVSLVLPSFWMLSTLATLISIYNDIQDFKQNDWTSITSLVNDCSVFTISVIQLIISNIAEMPSPQHATRFQEECPLDGVSFSSRLTLSWLVSLFSKSIQNSLHQNFLLTLCYELRSTSVARSFQKVCLRKKSETSTPVSEEVENLIGSDSESPEPKTNSNYPNGKYLLTILLRLSSKFLLIASFLEVVYTSLYFLPAYILSLLLGSKNEKQEWHNYLYAMALFITLLFSALADSQRKYYGLMAAVRIKTAVMNALFEKALRVSKESIKLKQLITNEANHVFQMVCMMTEIWGTCIRLLVGIYILWSFLGSSCFVGLAVAVLLIPINVIVEQLASHFQNKAHEKKQERLNIISDCIHGMKVLKLYAWENIFLKRILSVRKSEISEIRKAEFLKMTFKFVVLSGSSLVTLATFAAFVLMGNKLDVIDVFVSLLIINMLKIPFRSLIHLLAHFIQGLSSISTIQSFLETKELGSNLPSTDNLDGNSVRLTNSSFSYDGMDTPCLRNLNLHIPKGSLIAVVGETRSGKSSLLRALLGELEAVDGSAHVDGSLAFVSDKPWIQNMTLEKNILFLNRKDEKMYHRVLEACALRSDIDGLPAGEETEIGEMGVHLSMEQKFKVELARSVYQNSDIYLLDDPMKYMNDSLAEHLFHRVIGRSGLLKGKTRILSTLREEFLPLVDHIIFLKEGRILEQGSFTELTEKNGYFSVYIKSSRQSRTLPRVSPDVKTHLSSENLGCKGDLWYSATVNPAKTETEHVICEEALVSAKGLGHKLWHLTKTVGSLFITTSLLLAGLACACEVASGVWLSDWTDGNGGGKKTSLNLIVFSGFIFSQVLLTILCGILIFSSTTLTAGKLHTWLLHQIMRASQISIEMTPARKIIQSFDRDFHYVDEKIAETFYVWLIAALRTPALLVVIFVVSPYLAILTIPLIFAFLAVQKLYLNAWQQLQHLTVATSCPLSNLLDETIQGATNIRATKSSSHFIERFRSKLDTHNNCTFIFLLATRWLNSSADIISSFLVLLTTLMAFHEGHKCTGFIGLAIVYSIKMADNLSTMVYMSTMLSNDLAVFGRLKSFSQLKQESEWNDPTNDLSSSWPHSGEISIQNLSTSGEGMSPLHQISLSIKAGEKVAIVGKEESGTSTLLYSLFRLIEPLEGQIVIDDVNISNLGLRDLRSKLAIIPQDALVFDGTIRQNLDPCHEYRDDELWSALEVSDLKSKISNLDSAIERCMSEEEKNLLSVTRCLLKNPKIVIIDEPSQHPESKLQIFQESTVVSFCEQPHPDFNGRIIRLLSGEIVNEEFSTV